jgi:hypothetical protein
MIASRHLFTHLARVQAEQAALAANEREAVEARLVALTLTDHVPIDQPSKLWTSHNEFQEDVSIHLPDHSVSLPINDILEAVSHLSLSQAGPSTKYLSPSDTISTASTLMPPSLLIPSHNQTQTNRRTTKVLQILDQMDVEIGICITKLSRTPIANTLREVKSTLDLLHPKLAKVTCRTPSIDLRKREITEQLMKLEALFTEWTCILNVEEPVLYNCGGYIVSNLLSQ